MFNEKMGMGLPEQLTPEQINKNRKKYEKSADKLARKKTNILEKLTGTGVTKDEIIRVDADLENAARKRAKQNLTPDSKEQLDALQNSILDIKSGQEIGLSMKEFGNLSIIEYGREKETLSGHIGDHKVEITVHYAERSHDRSIIDEAEGFIDGKKMTEDDAREIFEKYAETSRERIDKINEMKDQKREKLLGDSANKENDERRKNTTDMVKDIL